MLAPRPHFALPVRAGQALRPVGQIGISVLPAGRATGVRLGARLALFDSQVPRFRSAACRSSPSSSSLVWPHCAIVVVARVPCCWGLLIQQTAEGSVDSMRPDRPGLSVRLGCWARGRAGVGASCSRRRLRSRSRARGALHIGRAPRSGPGMWFRRKRHEAGSPAPARSRDRGWHDTACCRRGLSACRAGMAGVGAGAWMGVGYTCCNKRLRLRPGAPLAARGGLGRSPARGERAQTSGCGGRTPARVRTRACSTLLPGAKRWFGSRRGPLPGPTLRDTDAVLAKHWQGIAVGVC